MCLCCLPHRQPRLCLHIPGSARRLCITAISHCAFANELCGQCKGRCLCLARALLWLQPVRGGGVAGLVLRHLLPHVCTPSSAPCTSTSSPRRWWLVGTRATEQGRLSGKGHGVLRDTLPLRTSASIQDGQSPPEALKRPLWY